MKQLQYIGCKARDDSKVQKKATVLFMNTDAVTMAFYLEDEYGRENTISFMTKVNALHCVKIDRTTILTHCESDMTYTIIRIVRN